MLPYQFLQVKGTLLALAAQRGLVKPEDAGQALLHVGESIGSRTRLLRLCVLDAGCMLLLTASICPPPPLHCAVFPSAP